MSATIGERTESNLTIREDASNECVYRVRLRSSGTMTMALVEDVDVPNLGWDVVPRADKIAEYLCWNFGVWPERLVLIWQDDIVWPWWIAWVLGYHTRRSYRVATRETREGDASRLWKWEPCDKERVEFLMSEVMDRPGVLILDQNEGISRWRWEVEQCFWERRRKTQA